MAVNMGSAFLLVSVLLVCLNESAWSRKTSYCDIATCKNKSHTMCRFPSSKPGPNCTDYVSKPLTTKQKKILLDKHNKMRKYIADGLEKRGNPGPQPPASNMKQLVWDNELEKVAQRWNDQCTVGHDTCRHLARWKSGQNIATEWSKHPITDPIEDLMDGWYIEVKLFNKDWVKKLKFDHTWGHYSTWMWAETKYVGCAQAFYWTTSKKKYTMRLVCNYGPAGNYIGKPMYKIGKAGSACPNGTATIKGLCN